jgi:hypothetical protein
LGKRHHPEHDYDGNPDEDEKQPAKARAWFAQNVRCIDDLSTARAERSLLNLLLSATGTKHGHCPLLLKDTGMYGGLGIFDSGLRSSRLPAWSREVLNMRTSKHGIAAG